MKCALNSAVGHKNVKKQNMKICHAEGNQVPLPYSAWCKQSQKKCFKFCLEEHLPPHTTLLTSFNCRHLNKVKYVASNNLTNIQKCIYSILFSRSWTNTCSHKGTHFIGTSRHFKVFFFIALRRKLGVG